MRFVSRRDIVVAPMAVEAVASPQAAATRFDPHSRALPMRHSAPPPHARYGASAGVIDSQLIAAMERGRVASVT